MEKLKKSRIYAILKEMAARGKHSRNKEKRIEGKCPCTYKTGFDGKKLHISEKNRSENGAYIWE